MSTSSNSNSMGRRRHDTSLLSRSALDSPNPRGRAVHTSALLERISRLQSRLNERVMLAGLANSSSFEQRREYRSMHKDARDLFIHTRSPSKAGDSNKIFSSQSSRSNSEDSNDLDTEVQVLAGRVAELEQKLKQSQEDNLVLRARGEYLEQQLALENLRQHKSDALEDMSHTDLNYNTSQSSCCDDPMVKRNESIERITFSSENGRDEYPYESFPKQKASALDSHADKHQVLVHSYKEAFLQISEVLLGSFSRDEMTVEDLLDSEKIEVLKDKILEQFRKQRQSLYDARTEVQSTLSKIRKFETKIKSDSKAMEELNSLKTSHLEQSLTIQQLQQELHKSDALLHEADLKNKAVQAEVSLLQGRVKFLTNQLETKKSQGEGEEEEEEEKALALEEDCLDDRDEVKKQDLEVGGVLGIGAFAEVYMGWWRRPVAIKRFRNLIRQEQLDAFARETKILRSLDHQGITRFYGVLTDLPDQHLILECVIGRSFHQMCHDDKHVPLEEDTVLGLSLQLANIMSYVHSKKIVHRDLKPSNVLVNEAGQVKLIDFGLAHAGDHSKIDKKNIVAGTPVYLPPEVLREERVTHKLDVYSFAIILWEMLSRELPYNGLTFQEMVTGVSKNHLRPPIPQHARTEVADLISRCWADGAEERPDFCSVSESLLAMGAPELPSVQRAQYLSIQAM